MSIISYYIISFFKTFGLYYLKENPYQYITIISIALLLVILLFREKNINQTFKSNKKIVLFLIFWMFVGAMLGGILYTYHQFIDTEHKFVFYKRAISNMGASLYYGPIYLISFFPYNLFCLAIFYLLTKRIYKNL